MASEQQLEWFRDAAPPEIPSEPRTLEGLHAELRAFRDFGTATRVEPFPDPVIDLPLYVNEFWTSRQRAANALHEISYRACFKPQLPRFFIERLTAPGDTVYDPFMGRGTTLLEAALLGRRPVGCDINPLSRILLRPRLAPPTLEAVKARLEALDLTAEAPGGEAEPDADLLVFYHPDTLRQLENLRRYLLERERTGSFDTVDGWIRMVATNRLTGHSSGFFSVYTLPPNQAVSPQSQRKINAKRQQVPPPRDVPAIILKKSRSLLKELSPAWRRGEPTAGAEALLLARSCDRTPEIADRSVNLVVTSPPFLDVVDYQGDNWLRGWFNGIDPASVPLWQLRKPADWTAAMTRVFRELRRVLAPSGCIAFEVGEVRGGKLLMESLVVPAAREARLTPELVLVNDQKFTKTANCWGVSNLAKGTNTNRVILLRK